MIKEQQMVADFHKKFGCVIKDHPDVGDAELRFLRSRLILEEGIEFMTAANKGDMIEMTDALCDLLYVVYGAAVVMGVDLEPVFAEVHRSNMTKDGGGHDTGGKVVKGPNYTPPQVEGELRKQGYDPLFIRSRLETNRESAERRYIKTCSACGRMIFDKDTSFCVDCEFEKDK